MCDATSVWRKRGEEVRIECACPDTGLCYYHKKLRDGLLEPGQPIERDYDPRVGKLLRVEAGGSVLWTA